MEQQADRYSLGALEFGAVVALARKFLSGPLANARVARLEPISERAHIQHELDLVREALEYLRENSRPRFPLRQDPAEVFDRLAPEGAACSAEEILLLLDLMEAAADARAMFANSDLAGLASLAVRLADFSEIVRALRGKILPDGSIDSSASAELSRIRRALERLRAELQAALAKLVERLAAGGLLQESLVTLRNDRYVVPVRAEEKRRVAGVVHGVSASGATVFVEALETLPLNNELVELGEREVAEIARILAEWSARLRARLADLRAAAEILGELDWAFARAEFARAYDACIPEFHQARSLILNDVRHPLLETALAPHGERPVPLTIELIEPKTQMVVSGPNAGGKTVALKTVGVAVLMAQAGLPVLAREARSPVFGRVLADIGDQQSIEASLSTFSAHIANLRAMTGVAGPEDLVLLDELGASTEPSEGAALGIAILEHFRERRAMTFVTTHHARLKAYAAETPEAVSAAMEFDQATLHPTYRLLAGLPGKSSGIETARRLGLSATIVARAQNLLAPADAEAGRLIGSLHERRAELDEQLALLKRERAEIAAERGALEKKFEAARQAKLAELDKRLEETLKQHTARWEKALGELRAKFSARAEPRGSPPRMRRGLRGGATAAALERAARDDWNASVLEAVGAPAAGDETTPKEISLGATVRVRDISTPGRVAAFVSDDEVEIEVGRLRMRVPKSEVRMVDGTARVAASSPAAVPVRLDKAPAREPGKGAAEEINVIGATAEEARERVDEFLDRSYVAGRYRVRVVHGHGKGILKKALHEMFATHPHVEKFYAADPREGGTGATIVELKL